MDLFSYMDFEKRAMMSKKKKKLMKHSKNEKE